MQKSTLKVGAAQIAPVWLNREKTLDKIIQWVEKAAANGCDLVTFGEALLPGYPFWIERTEGAIFESNKQKEFHAIYLDNAVQLEAGHLDRLVEASRDLGINVITGCIERPAWRGGHSVYACLVHIDQKEGIVVAHRKLRPTYEERLSWSPGDGHGLRVHRVGAFTVGGLNCWENWMPLARAAMYGQGENLHVAIWPGSKRNTQDLTRHIAIEGRSFVISVSGLMRPEDVPEDFPYREEILNYGGTFSSTSGGPLADGGSCIAGPDGQWICEPLVGEEGLLSAEIDLQEVYRARQSFDPFGHYSRPDVLKLVVNRERRSGIEFE